MSVYLLIDSENTTGKTSIMRVKAVTKDHAIGVHVDSKGNDTAFERGARRKTWIAAFQSWDEAEDARLAGLEVFKAHEAAIAAARIVLRDATHARMQGWYKAMTGAPGARKYEPSYLNTRIEE